MGQTRTYNPLNEGYSGKAISTSDNRGYSGGSGQTAPQTMKPLPSAIIKPTTQSNQQSGNK